MLHSVPVGVFVLSGAGKVSGSFGLTGRRRRLVRICDKLRPLLSLDNFPDNKIQTILSFIKLVLTCNNLVFQGNHFIQQTGTAMGTRMAPTYANLYMGYLENELLDKSPLKPLVWKRYIDDIFFLWTHGVNKLNDFLQ